MKTVIMPREMVLEAQGWLKHGQVGPYEDWRKGCITVLDAPKPPPTNNIGGNPLRRLMVHDNACDQHDGTLCAEFEIVNGVFDRALPA
jgi:hypothetical protein